MTGSAFNTSLLGISAANNGICNNAKNIANSSTVGYKTFNTYYSAQVTGSGGRASAFSPGGVTSISQQQVDQQGALRQTNSSTDIAIDGSGFIVVTNTTNGTQDYSFTRAGSFTKDVNGNLVNASGFYLTGYPVDQYGVITPGLNTSELSSLQNINVSNVSGFKKPTTALTIAANLPGSTTGPNGLAIGGTVTQTSSIIDSLGESFNLVTTWTKTAPDTYTASISCPQASGITKGSATGDPYGGTTPMVVKFDSNGNPVSFDGNATPPSIYIAWDQTQTHAAPNDIAYNLGTVGKNNGLTSSGGAFNTTVNKNDGEQFGNFQNVSIDENGIVSAIFDNGSSLPIFQLAMAIFSAPNQLQSKTGDIWTQTTASGKAVLGLPKDSGFGTFCAGQLEESTTDLASELTNLIHNQQYYTANSKAIQTDIDAFNSLLQLHS